MTFIVTLLVTAIRAFTMMRRVTTTLTSITALTFIYGMMTSFAFFIAVIILHLGYKYIILQKSYGK